MIISNLFAIKLIYLPNVKEIDAILLLFTYLMPLLDKIFLVESCYEEPSEEDLDDFAFWLPLIYLLILFIILHILLLPLLWIILSIFMFYNIFTINQSYLEK
jgi:hypothetical protein